MLTDQRFINAMCCGAQASCEYLQTILTPEQVAELEKLLCPPPPQEVVDAEIEFLKARAADLISQGLITSEKLVEVAQAIAEGKNA